MLTESSLVRDCYDLSSIDKDLLTEKDVRNLKRIRIVFPVTYRARISDMYNRLSLMLQELLVFSANVQAFSSIHMDII